MKKLYFLAIGLLACDVPFRPPPPEPTPWAYHANYPSVPVEFEAPMAKPFADHIVLFECLNPSDCEPLACPGPCEEWRCELGQCVFADRAGRPCLRGFSGSEVGVCHGAECWPSCLDGQPCAECVCAAGLACHEYCEAE